MSWNLLLESGGGGESLSESRTDTAGDQNTFSVEIQQTNICMEIIFKSTFPSRTLLASSLKVLMYLFGSNSLGKSLGQQKIWNLLVLAAAEAGKEFLLGTKIIPCQRDIEGELLCPASSLHSPACSNSID